MNARVYRNIGWNGLFLLIQTGLALAVVPLLLATVGPAGFGVYAFFLAVLAAGALVQGGLDLAMSRSVARFRGDGDRAGLNAELSFGYVFAMAAGLVQAALVLGLVRLTGPGGGGDAAVTGALGRVFAVSLVLSAPLGVAQAVLSGLERFMQRNLVQILPPLAGLGAAVLLPVLDLGAEGIVLYAACIEITRFVVGLVNLLMVERMLPHLRSLAPRGLYRRDVIAFQAKQLGNQLADYLFYTCDRLTLQAVAGAVVVAHYAVAERPNTLAQAVISAPLVAIVPGMVTALAAGDRGYIDRMLTAGTRLYLWATVPVLIAVLISAPDLIAVWVGPAYADSARIAQIFVLCLLATAPFKIYSHYRLAEGTNGFMAAAKLGYAPLNAAASYVLATRWGLIGVVAPTALFYLLVFPGLWIVGMVRRGELTGYAQACARPLAAASLTLIAAAGLERSFSAPALLPAVGTAAVETILGVMLFATIGGGRQALRRRAEEPAGRTVEVGTPTSAAAADAGRR